MNISNTIPKNLTSLEKVKQRILCNRYSPMSILIQLCFHPNENSAYQTMKILFSPPCKYSSNLCDEFGCNILMYTLRYQRYKLLHFLLKDISFDLNLRSKDRYDNTILHYAIIYVNDNTQIIENLIEKFQKFSINIDERNTFGFTPLLLAVFCGRYDLALILLTKTNASPFVRDYIQLKNILDYVEIDGKQREFITKLPNIRSSSQTSNGSRESIRLRIQLHQTLPYRIDTANRTFEHQSSKNFFENIFPQILHDPSGSIRSSILTMFYTNHLSSDLTYLIHYLHRRYPRINTIRTPDINTTTKRTFQCHNSNINIHQIFDLFDPDLRPKAMPPKPLTTHYTLSHNKTSIAFKRLNAKLTVLNLSRTQNDIKTESLTTINRY